MFDKYLRKIMPIPITKIDVSKDGYKYLVYTYASVLDKDRGLQLRLVKRMHNNKKIKTFDGWYNDKNLSEKYALVEFYNGKKINN